MKVLLDARLKPMSREENFQVPYNLKVAKLIIRNHYKKNKLKKIILEFRLIHNKVMYKVLR